MNNQSRFALFILLSICFLASGCEDDDGASGLPNLNLRFDWLYENSPLPLYENSRENTFVFEDTLGTELRLEAKSEQFLLDLDQNGQAYTAQRFNTSVFVPGSTDTLITGFALVHYLNGRIKGEAMTLQLRAVDELFPGRFPAVSFNEPLPGTQVVPGETFTYAGRTFADVQIWREGMTEDGHILIVGNVKVGVVGFLDRASDTFYVLDRIEE